MPAEQICQHLQVAAREHTLQQQTTAAARAPGARMAAPDRKPPADPRFRWVVSGMSTAFGD